MSAPRSSLVMIWLRVLFAVCCAGVAVLDFRVGNTKGGYLMVVCCAMNVGSALRLYDVRRWYR